MVKIKNMITGILFLVIGLYTLTGIVLYFKNLNKPLKDRPLGFIKGSPFYVNPLSFILLSPAFSLTDIFSKLNKKKQKYINVNASEEEKRLYNLGTIANSQTETAPVTSEKAPDISSKSSDLLLALYNNDKTTAKKLTDTLSADGLQKALRVLYVASEQGDPELRAAIEPDMKFIKNALNKRNTDVHKIAK